MMRLAGRDSKGLAKAIKTTQEGNIVTESKKTARQFIGEFKEPFDEGYVGNIVVSGLEIYEKIEVSDEVVDAKLGLTGIYIAYKFRIEKYIEGDTSTPVWTYNLPVTNDLLMIALDYEDNVIWTGRRDRDQVIEKINSSNVTVEWRHHDTIRAGAIVTDLFIDKNGDVYAVNPHTANDQTKVEITKRNANTGVIVWVYVHTNPGQTLQVYGTIDSNGYLYLSTLFDFVKLDQSLANVSTPPAVVWSVSRRITDAYGEYMFVTVDVDGFIYRVENDYKWNAGSPARDVRLVKFNQSTGEPVVEWTVIVPNPTNMAITEAHSKPYLDDDGNVYFNLEGKIDSSKNNFWNGVPPITITDVRDNFLVGFNKVRGYNGDLRYVIYKTGINLEEYYQMGVR